MRDTLNGYAPKLLELALGRASQAYRLIEHGSAMAQGRAMVEMTKADSPIDVFWTVPTAQRESSLLPIPIPIERGLMGWRIALIRHADRERWRSLRTLSELTPFVAGQKHDWPDTEVLRANGLQVQTSAQYESLFRMLQLGRVDYFPRSVLEIESELDTHRDMDLDIDPYLLLQYPSTMYFFVRPGRESLAEDLRSGLERAQADGSFERLFQRTFSTVITRLRLQQRHVLRLHHPAQSSTLPLHRKDLWLLPPA